MQEEEKKHRGERGPDKVKRKYAGGMPPKPQAEKVQTWSVNLTIDENNFLINKFGSRTIAIKTLLPKKKKPKK